MLDWINVFLVSPTWIAIFVISVITLGLLPFVWNPTGYSKQNIRRITAEFFDSPTCCIPLLLMESPWEPWGRVGLLFLVNIIAGTSCVMGGISLENALGFLAMEMVFVGFVVYKVHASLKEDLGHSRTALEVRKGKKKES